MIMDAIRTFFFLIDSVIYEFVGIIYGLLNEIANTTIFTEEIIDLFASKVYALLGIFMLFKVSFSIMTYIVNPDDFTDKNKGFGKLITNIMTTLILLIFTPWIFSQAMDIQRIVLKDNIIGKIFSTNASVSFFAGDNIGKQMAYQTFTAFYQIDDAFKDQCTNVTDKDNCTLFGSHDEYRDALNMAQAYEDISLLKNYDLLNYEKNDQYVMSYKPLVSSVVGGFMAWILIIFCFDIAVRSVKLGFLRIIAPIPIISRVDPKSKGVFDKWFKNCVSTYLDLFIRLLAIFFALFVIQQSFNMEFVNAATGLPQEVGIFTKIFIIMGALLFAKQLPKLLSDLTGAKLDGKFTLNPFDKLRQVPVIGSAATTATALAGGAITGGIAGYQAGFTGRGIAQGILGAAHSIKGKVPLMGGDGKDPHAFTTGLQSGYKAIKGKDYEIFSPLKYDFSDKGKKQIDELKTNKYALQGEQASLDAELQSLYDQYTKSSPELQEKIRLKIESNRSRYGKLSKYISTIDDQISDIKHMLDVEESPKKDLAEALSEAEKHKVNNSSLNISSMPITPSYNINNNANTTINSNAQTIINDSNTEFSPINISEPASNTSSTASQETKLNAGETVTPGGIILQSGYDRPSNKKETKRETHKIDSDYSKNSEQTQHNSEW